MTATAANLATTAPQPLLPALARFAIAVAVGLVLTALCIEAETQSRLAIDTSALAVSPNAHHVLLPEVQIIGHRNAKARSA